MKNLMTLNEKLDENVILLERNLQYKIMYEYYSYKIIFKFIELMI